MTTTKRYLFKNKRSGNTWKVTPVPGYLLENLNSGSKTFVMEPELKRILSNSNVTIMEESFAVMKDGDKHIIIKEATPEEVILYGKREE